jgi:hypothetical protein
MTKVYKNIEFDTEQLAISITALEHFINAERESMDFYFERLNGAGTTQDVKDWTDQIKASKNRIKNLKPLIEQMASNQFITKHTL